MWPAQVNHYSSIYKFTITHPYTSIPFLIHIQVDHYSSIHKPWLQSYSYKKQVVTTQNTVSHPPHVLPFLSIDSPLWREFLVWRAVPTNSSKSLYDLASVYRVQTPLHPSPPPLECTVWLALCQWDREVIVEWHYNTSIQTSRTEQTCRPTSCLPAQLFYIDYWLPKPVSTLC